jgi:DNA polymerase-3 subunit alpha
MLEYTANKYGRDKVAQIITFGTLGARAAIRDVGRVLDIPLPEVDRVAKVIPNIPGKPVSIPEALQTVTQFDEIYQSTPYLREMIDTAAKLEGVSRNAGTHAAGVIITPNPIIEFVPLHRPTKGNQEDNPIGAITQFEMQILDDLGLLKVDFLGLSTLSVMARACEMIRERHGNDLDIHSIPLDDPETYELLGRGDVLGVFQVEGAGMRRNLMDMKPTSLPHVIAMVALYRPGPMDFIPQYIRRMHEEEEVSYRHPLLEPILEETFGITVYQEQIMYTAMDLGGYTASEADDLRKAVAKKKADVLQDHRGRFVAGAVEKGISEQVANSIFDDWEAFARYGFPKGHAADYAVICVQTAYLKAHYSIEYMTALLSVFKHDTDKVALYIADCRRMGIDVLPPHVNYSGLDFMIEDRPDGSPAIRFGLAAIKNVGESAVQVLVDAREESGPSQDLQEFVHKVDLRHVGKRAIECLVRVGAFDGLASRSALLESLDRVMNISAAYFRAKEAGQLSLFGSNTGVREKLELPQAELDVSRRQKLDWERELLGVYVSDHPLSPYMDDLTRIVTHFSAELSETNQGQKVTIAGEICQVRPYQTRTGKAMGFATLEDLQGSIDLVIFNRVWQRVSEWLEPGIIVQVRGKIDRERGDPKVLVDHISQDISPAPSQSEGISVHREIPWSPPDPMDIQVSNEGMGDADFQHSTEVILEDVAILERGEEGSDSPESGSLQEVDPAADPVADHAVEPAVEPGTDFKDFSDSEVAVADVPTITEEVSHEGQVEASEELQDPGESPPVVESTDIPSVQDEEIQDLPVPMPEKETLVPESTPPAYSTVRASTGGDLTMVKVFLRSTGDKKRDALRMRRVYGLLTTFPGADRFAVYVFEGSRRYHLEFPNETTGYCPELQAQLKKLVGEANIRVEPLRLQ